MLNCEEKTVHVCVISHIYTVLLCLCMCVRSAAPPLPPLQVCFPGQRVIKCHKSLQTSQGRRAKVNSQMLPRPDKTISVCLFSDWEQIHLYSLGDVSAIWFSSSICRPKCRSINSTQCVFSFGGRQRWKHVARLEKNKQTWRLRCYLAGMCRWVIYSTGWIQKQ